MAMETNNNNKNINSTQTYFAQGRLQPEFVIEKQQNKVTLCRYFRQVR